MCVAVANVPLALMVMAVFASHVANDAPSARTSADASSRAGTD